MLALHWQGPCLLPIFLPTPPLSGSASLFLSIRPSPTKRARAASRIGLVPTQAIRLWRGDSRCFSPILIQARTISHRASHRLASHSSLQFQRPCIASPASPFTHVPWRRCCVSCPRELPGFGCSLFQDHRRLGPTNLLLISGLSIGLCLCCVVVWLCGCVPLPFNFSCAFVTDSQS